MKITARQLRTIIKEELEQLTEQSVGGGARYAVAVSVDAQVNDFMSALASMESDSSGAQQRVQDVMRKLDSIPMNTPFTARDLMLDPVALTPQLQDELTAINMEKAGTIDGTTIISFGTGDDEEAFGMYIGALMRMEMADDESDVTRGDRVEGGIFRSGDFTGSEQ